MQSSQEVKSDILAYLPTGSHRPAFVGRYEIQERKHEFRMNSMRIACTAVSLLVLLVFLAEKAGAQGSATNLAKTASPELVGLLLK